jgi:hypothetical protein
MSAFAPDDDPFPRRSGTMPVPRPPNEADLRLAAMAERERARVAGCPWQGAWEYQVPGLFTTADLATALRAAVELALGSGTARLIVRAERGFPETVTLVRFEGTRLLWEVPGEGAFPLE